MNAWLDVALTNAVLATGLALVAAAASRFTRPAVAHGFWLLVFVKLLTPPLLELGVVPRPEAASATVATVATEPSRSISMPFTGENASRPPGTTTTPRDRGPDWPSASTLAVTLWGAGALVLAALALLRLILFGRQARRSKPADAALARRLNALAARMDLVRCPPLRLLDSKISPLVFSLFGEPRIYLPRQLAESLEPAALDAVLTHELAHIKRRDHWVRGLELLVCPLFWWLPVTWWAKRSLHLAEELCCDEWVLKIVPGSRRAYADGLLETLELSVVGSAPLPALASGIASSRPPGSRNTSFETIEKRLIMIMKPRSTATELPVRRFLLAAASGILLVIFPTWAADEEPETADARKAEKRLAFEAESLAFEEQRRGLEARELAERRAALAAERFEIERQRHQETRAIELEAHHARLETEALQAHGRALEAEEARRRAEASRLELEQYRLELELRQHETEKLSSLEAREQDLRNQFRDIEKAMARHQVKAELAAIHTALPLRLPELRQMLESVDENGELGEKLDQLEAALALALPQSEAD